MSWSRGRRLDGDVERENEQVTWVVFPLVPMGM
jgi:hypothetical protein